MKFFHLLIFFISYISVFDLSSLNTPVTLPQDQSGLETAIIDKSGEYTLIVRYLLKDLKKEFKDQKYFFIIPIPSSNDSQVLTVEKTVNFEIDDISKDIYGNAVIITKPVVRALAPDFFEIHFSINLDFLKFFIPKNYKYNIQFSRFVLNKLKQEEIQLLNLTKAEFFKFSADQTSDLNFSGIIRIINNYKAMINGSKEPFKRIYDKKIIEFYPFTREDYRSAANDLLAVLKAKKIYGRINYGLNFPDRLDFFNSDFIIEVFIPAYGVISFDMYLDLFSNSVSFISFFYQTSVKDDNYRYGYIGVVNYEKSPEKTIINFLNAQMIITGCEKSDKNDKRLNNYFISESTLILQKTEYDDFIDDAETLLKNKVKFNVFYKENNNREYFAKAANNFINEIIICSGIENHKPAGIRKIFFEDSNAFAYIPFKTVKGQKSARFTWIRPDGSKYYENIYNIPEGWGYTYVILADKKEYKLMKGIWTLEAYINGLLDARQELELR
jgi:hypothetical protein